MSCPRRKTPGDGRNRRQGTSLLNRAGENAACIGILGVSIKKVACGRFF